RPRRYPADPPGLRLPPARAGVESRDTRRGCAGRWRAAPRRQPRDRFLLRARDIFRAPVAGRGRAVAGRRASLDPAAMRGGIAVLGAGGFVGSRLLERAAHAGRTDIVPVVRAARSVGRTANLGISHRFGDASRAETLERALAGCEAVVNLTTGDPADIPRTTENIYTAALAAGARLLVHLSSASVYGAVEQPDLPDDAPPWPGHWMAYARQKGVAENFLRERMAERRLAIVVLRPGLVWGPGSPWVLGPATDLLRGAAFLAGSGGGICNLMYVDDLLRGIDAVGTREIWHLQTTRYRLPTTKFRATFGDHNMVPFPVGMAASLAWLRFIGIGLDEAA